MVRKEGGGGGGGGRDGHKWIKKKGKEGKGTRHLANKNREKRNLRGIFRGAGSRGNPP